MIELTEEQKRTAVNLAMTIECGIYPLEEVVQLLKKEPIVMQSIIYFWLNFNDMTVQVAKLVMFERMRLHLENCFKLGTVEHP